MGGLEPGGVEMLRGGSRLPSKRARFKSPAPTNSNGFPDTYLVFTPVKKSKVHF